MTIAEAGQALRSRAISSVELTRQCLDQIAKLNPVLNAFITVTAESALARAEELDRELARGMDRGPLHGIPIAHKDLMWTKGVRTTSGSKIFADFVPDRDAPVVRTAGRGRRGDGRQNRTARAGVRDHFRQPAFRDHSKPAQSRAFAGRIERRVGRCGSHRNGIHGNRYRYRRIHSRPCIVLRGGRIETNLRAD